MEIKNQQKQGEFFPNFARHFATGEMQDP